MAGSKVISQVEVLSAEDGVRRREWSDADKVRIVEESLRGYRQGSATARRYGLSRSLLTRWRKEYRQGVLGGSPAAFMALQITAAPDPLSCVGTAGSEAEERIEITLTNGRRLSVSTLIDGCALARLVQVLERA